MTRRYLLLGAAGFAVALMAALLPSRPNATTYEWVVRGGDATLPLVLHDEPAEIVAHIPCQSDGVLTTNRPGNGLGIDAVDGTVVVTAGGNVLGSSASCPTVVIVTPTRWTITSDADERTGALTDPVTVAGLNAGGQFEGTAITITTAAHGSSPTVAQIALWAAAFGLSVAAITGAIRDRRPSRPRRRLRVRIELTDVAVVAGIVTWVVLGPPLFDDGWVLVRQRAFAETGVFSGYFVGDAAVVPLGYWADWLMQWWTTRVESPVMLRLPLAAIGVGTWSLLRITARRLGGRLLLTRLGSWTMAIAFSLAYCSWLQTLRPEPFIALLSLVSLDSIAAFRESGSFGRLTAAMAAAVAAVLLHPAGILATAPLFVSWRSIGAAIRADRARVTAIVGGVAAIGLVLFTIDSDLSSRISEMTAVTDSDGTHSFGVRDELLRYLLLDASVWANPLRRLFVIAALGTVLSHLSERHRRGDIRYLPVRSLILGLVMLSLVPSKWPWHFGSLSAFFALALAIEVTTWPERAPTRHPVLVGSVIAVGTAIGSAWAWSLSEPWTAPDPGLEAFDVRTIGWQAGGGNVLPVSLAAIAPWLGLVLLLTAFAYITRKQHRTDDHPLMAAAQRVVPVAMALVLGYSAGTFALDTMVTDGWTFGAQNLDHLRGESTCGLGDDLALPAIAGATALAPSRSVLATAAPVGDDPPISTPIGSLPAIAGISASDGSRWFESEPGSDLAVLVSGRGSGSVGVEHRGETNAQAATSGTEFESDSSWRLVPVGTALGEQVRIEVSEIDPETTLMVSGPIAYDTIDLGTLMRRPGFTTLVTPEAAYYFPCAQQPSIANGAVEIPDAMVLRTTLDETWIDVFAPAADVADYVEVDALGSPLVRVYVRADHFDVGTLRGT